MKTKVTLHKDLLSRDYEYWQEQSWLQRKFYEEQNLPVLKASLVRFVVNLRVRKMKRELDLVMPQPSGEG